MNHKFPSKVINPHQQVINSTLHLPTRVCFCTQFDLSELNIFGIIKPIIIIINAILLISCLLIVNLSGPVLFLHLKIFYFIFFWILAEKFSLSFFVPLCISNENHQSFGWFFGFWGWGVVCGIFGYRDGYSD